MLYYNKTDVSEGIDVIKINTSKELTFVTISLFRQMA